MHQAITRRWVSGRDALRDTEARLRHFLAATGPVSLIARALLAAAFITALGLLFGWAGVLCAMAIVGLSVFAWPGRWLAMPAATLIPALGLLPYVWDEAATDSLAMVIVFTLFAAAAVELVARRKEVDDFAVDVPHPRATSDNIVVKTVVTRAEYLIPAAIAAVAAQSWFTSGTLIAFGDIFPFIDPGNLLAKSLPTWSTLADGLGSRSIGIVIAPMSAVVSILQSLGLSDAMTERIVLTGLFVGEALAISYLIATVWPNARLMARLAGSMFYLFNLLAFFNLPGAAQMLAFSLLPLLAALMIRGLRSGRNRYAVIWALVSIALSYVAANPPLAVATALGSIVIAVAVQWARGGDLRSVARFSARAFPLSLLLNLWWVVPVAMTIGGSTGIASIPTSPEEWGWTQARNSFANLLSLNASWGWPQLLYFPYATAYQNPILGVITYAPAAIGFGALAFRTQRSRLVPLLASMSLVLIFLSKGLHAPFENVNAWITDHVPGFWIIREPASKLLPIVVVLLSLLIVWSVNKAADMARLGRYSQRFKWMDPAGGVVAVGLLLPLAAWPVITGDIVADERPTLPPVHISIPEHWEAAAGLLNSPEEAQEGAVLVLPLSDYYQMPYEWGFYGTDAIASHLIRRPVVQGTSLGYIPALPAAHQMISGLEAAIRHGDAGEGERLMKALGIRYVLVRGDIDRHLAEQLNRYVINDEAYDGRLSESSLVSQLATFGPLTLYESTWSDAGPMTTWSAVRDARAAPYSGSRPGSDEVATVDSPLDVDLPVGRAPLAPEMRLTDASESRYVAEIDGVDGPFLMTLNQNFDEGWRAFISGRDEPLPHVVANGFANGWLVSGEGSMEVVVEYGPEKWALYARAASILGVVVLGAMALRPLVKRLTARSQQAPSAASDE